MYYIDYFTSYFNKVIEYVYEYIMKYNPNTRQITQPIFSDIDIFDDDILYSHTRESFINDNDNEFDYKPDLEFFS